MSTIIRGGWTLGGRLFQGAGLAFGIPFGYSWLPEHSRSQSMEELFRTGCQGATAYLKSLSLPVIAAPPPPPPGADLSALLAAQNRTLELLLGAQARSNARSAIAWLLPAGAATALAIAYYKGWNIFGWVSLEQLQEGLAAVRQSLVERISQLREEVMLRFEQLQALMSASDKRLEGLQSGVSGLEGQVAQVHAAMGDLDGRLGKVELNTKRSAEGVELLVHLVSASNVFADVDADVTRRLRAFNELPPPPERPALTERSASCGLVTQIVMALPPAVASS